MQPARPPAPQSRFGGPWWVTSFPWGSQVAVVQFKAPAGYVESIRLIDVGCGIPPTLTSPATLRRAMVAAASRFCSEHGELIAHAAAYRPQDA